jgi:hypothetical protein
VEQAEVLEVLGQVERLVQAVSMVQQVVAEHPVILVQAEQAVAVVHLV